jgi:ribosomal protein S18 acetylase RimI-like enzyme
MADDEARPTATIRRARPGEAAALSELAFRSKAHWGYDADFMAASRADLTLSVAEVEADPVYVADAGGRPLGFYRLRGDGAEGELVDLWVAPEAIGRGLGRRLWRHALATARRRGFRALTLQSDPHAEGFYLAMGARRVGESASTVVPGRMLPLMRVDLA